jgi:hypothetical protein
VTGIGLRPRRDRRCLLAKPGVDQWMTMWINRVSRHIPLSSRRAVKYRKDACVRACGRRFDS